MIRLKRAYEPPAMEDGERILVERLWPRGVSKERADIERWMKEIAPSTELRRWFAHDPAKWEEFRERYRAELAEKPELITELREKAKRGTITLVYAARDEAHNSAVVLQEYLKVS